jgi:hypothetical protein
MFKSLELTQNWIRQFDKQYVGSKFNQEEMRILELSEHYSLEQPCNKFINNLVIYRKFSLWQHIVYRIDGSNSAITPAI